MRLYNQAIVDICKDLTEDINLLRVLCQHKGIDTRHLKTHVIDENNNHDPHGSEYHSTIEVWTDWDSNRLTVGLWGSRRERHIKAKVEWMRSELLKAWAGI